MDDDNMISSISKQSGTSLLRSIRQYTESISSIHEYFGYVEDWVTIPLDFSTISCEWWLDTDANGYGSVYFTGKDGESYSHDIYTQRFLPKWVYRAADFTMISCDTRVDGNKYLCIFDNSMESTEDIRNEG